MNGSQESLSVLEQKENLIQLAALVFMLVSYSAGVYLRYKRTTDLQIDCWSFWIMWVVGFMAAAVAFWPGVSCVSASLQHGLLKAIVAPAAGTFLLLFRYGWSLPEIVKT